MKSKKYYRIFSILIVLFLLFSSKVFSQVYVPVLRTYLDEKISENSGLICYDGELWTHNDSGGESKLYNIDINTGLIKRTKIIRNAVNRDWEDICMDGKYAYIGDIGNNSGTLDYFTIYKILLEDLNSGLLDSIDSEKIIFTYDPIHYNKQIKNDINKTNFDCEAMIVKGDSIYLFSKNWIDKKCYFYSIPKKPGKYIANLRDSIDTKGLICGADYNEETNTLALVGYVYGIPAPSILMLLSDFEGDNFFKGNFIRKELELIGTQTESIVFINDTTLWISNEAFLGHKQALYEVIIKNDFLSFELSSSEDNDIFIFNNNNAGRYKLKIINNNGKIISEVPKRKYLEGTYSIKIPQLDRGEYIMTFFNSRISFNIRFCKS